MFQLSDAITEAVCIFSIGSNKNTAQKSKLAAQIIQFTM